MLSFDHKSHDHFKKKSHFYTRDKDITTENQYEIYINPCQSIMKIPKKNFTFFFVHNGYSSLATEC